MDPEETEAFKPLFFSGGGGGGGIMIKKQNKKIPSFIKSLQLFHDSLNLWVMKPIQHYMDT